MKVLICLLLFLPLISLGQDKRKIADQHLCNLKNGVLLIRLYTSESKIEALKKLGRNNEAEEVIRKQELENRLIYTTFKAVYDFSPIYFFYNTSSDKIKMQEYRGNLLNEELKPDSGINISEEFIYIADVDLTPGTGIYALVIKDKNFQFLNKPFPYYIKRFNLLPIFKRTLFEMVDILNKKLNKDFNNI